VIPWIEWTTYHIGPITLQVWGTFVALGILLSCVIIKKCSLQFGVRSEQMLDMVIWLLVGGFIGARLGHVFLYEPTYYLSHPVDMIKVWEGGLSSFGGFVGAGVSFYLFAKKKNLQKVVWKKVSDLLLFSGLYGWMVARVGCFLIHDHPGTLSHSLLAMKNPSGSRFDMAFLEIIGLLPLAVWAFISRHKKLADGQMTAVIFVYYGILRFILDFFRAIDSRYLGLTPGQYFAMVMVVLGLVLLIKTRK